MRTTDQFWPWWRRTLMGLTMLALVLSAIMSWHQLAGGTIVGCGGGSPCQQVLNSKWSVIAGIIPISGLAMGVYLGLLVACLFIGPAVEAPVRRLAWNVILILAGSVAGSAIWFTFVQRWIIGDFCPYCIAIHITGILLAALVIWRAIHESPGRRLAVIGRVMTGLVLAGVLAGIQVSFTPATLYNSGQTEDILPDLDYHTIPVAGSPEAPYVVTLLFDYQCSHCQKLYFMLDEAIRQYNGKLAFALCPAPLNPECNPYIPPDADAFRNSCELAKISLAVWIASQETFPAFENWMFTYESGDSWHPRSTEKAREKAIELVGREKFEAALTNPWIGQYLQTSTRIYGRTIQNGKGGIPKMIFGSRWVIPEPSTANDLVMILQKSLAVPLP